MRYLFIGVLIFLTSCANNYTYHESLGFIEGWGKKGNLSVNNGISASFTVNNWYAAKREERIVGVSLSRRDVGESKIVGEKPFIVSTNVTTDNSFFLKNDATLMIDGDTYHASKIVFGRRDKTFSCNGYDLVVGENESTKVNGEFCIVFVFDVIIPSSEKSFSVVLFKSESTSKSYNPLVVNFSPHVREESYAH